MIHVRRAEASDAQALWQIFQQPKAMAETLQLPFPSLQGWEQNLEKTNPDFFRLAAEYDELVVGSLSLMLQANLRRRHCASIGMAVADSHSGQGVGSALMAAALDMADNWFNIRRVELTVFIDNAKAIGLYEKYGFHIEGELAEYAWRNGELVSAYQMARLRRP